VRPRNLVATAALTILVLATASASQANIGFSVSLNGAQAGTPSPGTGTGTLIVNDAQTQVTYNIAYTNLLGNRADQHIHGPAPAGLTAGVLVGLAGTGTRSGTISGTATVNATIVAYMLAGDTYVNIHTSMFEGDGGGGEIRGQITHDVTPARLTTWGRIKRLYR
jgi:CHRD domain-containing protein